jgi:CrcB protein
MGIMNAYGFLSVGMGAALGAWLRWWFGIFLNPIFPTIPLGTLSANLLGGFLMGITMEMLSRHTFLPPETRLFVATGFLGGLTTFSTFSAEIATLLLRQEYAWFAVAVSAHLAGSLTMTILGIYAMKLVLFRGAL